MECLYSQPFVCIYQRMFSNVKPDGSFCLCMTCLNPELKLEALKKFDQLNKDLDVQLLVNKEKWKMY